MARLLHPGAAADHVPWHRGRGVGLKLEMSHRYSKGYAFQYFYVVGNANTTVTARRQTEEPTQMQAPSLVSERAKKAGMPAPPWGRNE